jgi:hypothetical protein
VQLSASVIFVLSVNLSGTQILDIVGYQELCKDSVSKTGNYVSIPSIVASRLAELIAAERLIAKIDKANFAIADAATHDAMIMIRRVKLGGTPHILLSDDGILALQWQRGEYGVALFLLAMVWPLFPSGDQESFMLRMELTYQFMMICLRILMRP